MFRRKKEELPADIRRAADALATAQEIFEQQEAPANYSTALNWLLGLSDKEYQKMVKVVEIYRKANSDTAKALGIKTEPTSFLPQPDNTELVPQDVNHLAPASTTPPADDTMDDFLDDELNNAFLEDDQPKPGTMQAVAKNLQPETSKPPVQVPVKDENDKPADKPKS